MMNRRALLRSLLWSSGAAATQAALGSSFVRAALAQDTVTVGPVVTTTLGRVRGAIARGVYSFKGIHYGASTEGAMRFLPASPAKPWSGVRDALELGPLAPQDRDYPGMEVQKKVTGVDLLGPGAMSEDCLVLNVWSPSLRGRRPVMVWLHGGWFAIGSGGAELYDGTNLAAKHDVVVVTINHRLNVFGYLNLAAVGGEKYRNSANVGMLDIVLALNWVRANISGFGGDPGNVTIFGQSGGGGKVSVLMAMPSAAGLFHKAIVESGSEVQTWTSRDAADANARKLIAQLGVTPEHLDELQRMPIDRLVAAVHSMGSRQGSFGPVVDGHSLPRQPFDPDAPAATAGVPMLIGTTDAESTLFSLGEPELFSLDEANLRTRLRAYLRLTDDSRLEAVIAACRKDRPNATPSDVYFAVTTDRGHRMDAIVQAERKAAQHKAPAYMYIFAWQAPVQRGGLQLRAPHGIEIPFAFDSVAQFPAFLAGSSDVQAIADNVSRAWVAFARSGNPNHSGLPQWPAYNADTRATMIFDSRCQVVNDPGRETRLALTALAAR